MYLEDAAWIRGALAAIELPPGAGVLNAASSTEHYRTVEQPQIESEVLAPLRDRGAEIVHLDAKRDSGVDIVCDIAAPGLDPRRDIGRDFDLVLCTGLLQHLTPEQLPRAASALSALVRPGGFLLITTPLSYRRTEDPADHGYRPTPAEMIALMRAADPRLDPVASEAVRIDARRYYKGFVSRPSWTPVGGRWIPLPGFSELIRYRVKRLRWRQSCALLAKRADVAG